MRSRSIAVPFLFTLLAAIALLSSTSHHVLAGGPRDRDDGDEALQSDSRVQRGFEIAPVRLDVGGRKRGLVGLGSYLVNAVGGCNDCHTCPSYAPGHSPYTGGDGKLNDVNYLAGGVHFGPFTSANITPDFSGHPAGLTLQQFTTALRTGHVPDMPGQVLQVMPWPVFRNMTDQDIAAIYEYLSAIPHATPGVACSGAGQ
jgi:hypothetical protein